MNGESAVEAMPRACCDNHTLFIDLAFTMVEQTSLPFGQITILLYLKVKVVRCWKQKLNITPDTTLRNLALVRR